MKNRWARIARSVLAPRAIILGLSAFQFGLSLAEQARHLDGCFENRDAFAELFVAATILLSSACLAARRAAGNLLAAFLCGPMPLLHALVFFDTARRAEALPLSGAHVAVWAHELSYLPANLWLMSALSFAVLAFAITSTLRPSSPRPTAGG
jgi:hypothetical protein